MERNLKRYDLRPHEAMILDQLIIKNLSPYLAEMAKAVGLDPTQAKLNALYSITGPEVDESEPDNIQPQG